MAWKRFTRDDGVAGDQRRGGVATQTEQAPPPAQAPVPPDPEDRYADHDPHPAEDRRPGVGRRGAATTAAAATHHEARDRFGGLNWGAAFFGWLTAIGMAAILTAILSAAGAAIGISEGSVATAAEDNADTVSIVGGVLLLLVLATAYFCGGYVAGRMSRFDGKRQGFGVWAIGLVITIAIAAAAAIFGSEYNILNQLNLPRIPVDEGDLATGGAIALALALLTTLIGAVLGGAKGRHYHDRVDRADGRDW
ncbi:MAG: hypothetical protein QOE60_1344 [Thermoleophilaceae bacterium]|nr:hypothetical protein [Thermoleophilaceae bacterium]